MNDRLHIGAVFRAIRLEQRLRQLDVARRAGVTQQTVSRVERGQFGGLSVDRYVRIADALDAEVPLAPRLRGPRLHRLHDARHAELQTQFAALLQRFGWIATAEVTFNHYGERGSVDIVGSQECSAVITEIKPVIGDLQETLRTLGMKSRVVPLVMAREQGRLPANVATVLVVLDSTANRAIVSRHAAMIDPVLPARNVELRRWLERPDGAIAGIWFFRNTPDADSTRKSRGTERVRLSAEEAERAARRRR